MKSYNWYESIRSFVKSYTILKIIWNHMKSQNPKWNPKHNLYTIIRNQTKSYELIWNHIKLYEIMKTYTNSIEIMWNSINIRNPMNSWTQRKTSFEIKRTPATSFAQIIWNLNKLWRTFRNIGNSYGIIWNHMKSYDINTRNAMTSWKILWNHVTHCEIYKNLKKSHEFIRNHVKS